MKKQTIILILSFFIATILYAQEKKYTTYRVVDDETISSIARKLGITPYDLLKLNPDAKDGIDIDEVLIIPNAKYKANEIKVIKVETPKIEETPTQVVELKRVAYAKDSIRRGYLYHTVRPQETIYSLCKKYRVSKRKARKLNGLKKKSMLSIGQVLKFPTKLRDTKPEVAKVVEPIYDTEKYIKYDVKPQDTYYSLTRSYNVTKQQLIETNPKLSEGLKAGDYILIPKAVEYVAENEVVETIITYKTHKVVAKEGFYRLKQKYGVTEEELIALNPKLKKGLKIGMEIRIPVKVKVEENLMYEGSIEGKELNVVMMLPFKADQSNTFSSKKGVFLNKVTDFYLGALIALEDLKKKGLSVNLKVFDTKNKSTQVAQIVNSYDFSKTDVVIGPMVFSRFKEAAAVLKSKNIPMISPIAKKDHGQIMGGNVVQNTASAKQQQNRILDFIKTRYTNQNIVIITDKKTKENKELVELKAYLQQNSTIKNVVVLHMKDGYIKRTLFEKNIKKKKENWVILFSGEGATSSVAVDNLGVYPKEFKITLFGLKKPKNIDKIKTHFLNRLTFHYPATSFVNEDNVAVSTFKEKYKNKNGAMPSEFSYKGYDTTYDALIRLANNYELAKAFQAGKSKRLESRYNYKLKPSQGFLNEGVFIVKYDNYHLKEVR